MDDDQQFKERVEASYREAHNVIGVALRGGDLEAIWYHVVSLDEADRWMLIAALAYQAAELTKSKAEHVGMDPLVLHEEYMGLVLRRRELGLDLWPTDD